MSRTPWKPFLTCGAALLGLAAVAPETSAGSVQYELALIPRTPNVDPGDSVAVDIYFTGTAPIGAHALTVHVPDRLADDTIIVENYALLADASFDRPRALLPAKRDTVGNHFRFGFAAAYFTRHPSGHLIVEQEFRSPKDSTYHSPLTIWFRVASNAPAGTHEITALFAYGQNTLEQIARTSTMIDVRSYGERNRAWLAAALSLLVVTVPPVHRRVRPRFGHWIISFAIVMVTWILYLLRS